MSLTTTTAPERVETTERAAQHGGAAAVHLRGVGKAFGDREVLAGVDLDIAPGEIVAILGPSGCGKSTLLRLVAGLDQVSAGAVTIDDQDVRSYDSRCAVGFQEPRLLPWRTIAANVELGMPHASRAQASTRVAELLDLVGLSNAATLRPRQVSGGMAQRASLARAIARDPAVLLLDEPFGSLDALTRLQMQDLLLAVHAASPTTVLLVTHDVDEALQVADRIVVLGVRDQAAHIGQVLTVPGDRPRDRGSADLAELRAQLLDGFGIDRHRR